MCRSEHYHSHEYSQRDEDNDDRARPTLRRFFFFFFQWHVFFQYSPDIERQRVCINSPSAVAFTVAKPVPPSGHRPGTGCASSVLPSFLSFLRLLFIQTHTAQRACARHVDSPKANYASSTSRQVRMQDMEEHNKGKRRKITSAPGTYKAEHSGSTLWPIRSGACPL